MLYGLGHGLECPTLDFLPARKIITSVRFNPGTPRFPVKALCSHWSCDAMFYHCGNLGQPALALSTFLECRNRWTFSAPGFARWLEAAHGPPSAFEAHLQHSDRLIANTLGHGRLFSGRQFFLTAWIALELVKAG